MNKGLVATATGVAALGIAFAGCGEGSAQREEEARKAYEEGANLGGPANAKQKMEKLFDE